MGWLIFTGFIGWLVSSVAYDDDKSKVYKFFYFLIVIPFWIIYALVAYYIVDEIWSLKTEMEKTAYSIGMMLFAGFAGVVYQMTKQENTLQELRNQIHALSQKLNEPRY